MWNIYIFIIYNQLKSIYIILNKISVVFQNGHKEVVEKLLDQPGVQVNKRGFKNRTPLDQALLVSLGLWTIWKFQ